MRIIIKTKNLELTNELQDFIEKKVSSTKKFIHILKEDADMGKTLAEVFVEVEKESQHHKKGEIFWAQASLSLPGKKNIVVRTNSSDLIKAVVGMVDEFKDEIKKYKLKAVDLHRREQRKAKNPS